MVRQVPPVAQHSQPRNELIAYYYSIPYITRFILTATVLLSLLPHFKIIPYGYVMLIWDDVLAKLQLWKLITCFFIHPISFNFIFTMMFLYRSSVSLETSTFFAKPAQYAYFLILAAITFLAMTSFIALYVLGGALEFAILTLWSLENAETLVSLYFGITFKAKYLPWIMAGLSFVLNASIPNDSLMGIGYSYLYHYLTTDFVATGGINYLEAPSILEKFFPAAGNTVNTHGYTATTPVSLSQGNSSGLNWGKGRRLGE